ncbi:undecaprenyldiphospho-muramoylpentapeptide beta-N-acetylglucosaminyltransferase [Flavihumibacter fluvii]|uniref:undecaprenyldiphospho-muramoylpentapeptide beta-N-acetylglucosaminyltransferase n=1 Tax=Flavihumibacter fluvii TaxID=2838157 RepID=UPI001BDE4260|nr:undecaprenyldiphospho-muramoylpentapeptide beta-N-acetylglucosaminyltransferase [Flavihumibacter fluvii]ULQ52632.1 undecaprenyldiphospho-muramoylpentapeptide beta-N-acetylglucosaminyltransferase [Flavihumibacter fluvii]
MGKRIIIAGGGTGGHIFPAIAIANALKKQDPTVEILFVGAKGKMEMQKVPLAGFEIEGLDIAGFNRSSLIKNISLPFKLIKSLLQVRQIFKRFKPDAVIGVGGYSSFPVLKLAQQRGLQSFLHESNSFAGKANQMLGKKASKIFVASDGMEKFFPKEKIMITGNPVRASIANSDINREEAIRSFGLDPAKTTVLSVGGSLGAKSINEAIAAGLPLFEESNLQLIWQTGVPFADQGRSVASGKSFVWVGEFITQMEKAYAAADVIISRAGAMAIAEICVVNKPAVLVPYPFAAEDHQTVNAQYLVGKGAAILLKDESAKQKLVYTTIALAKDKKLQAELVSHLKPLAVDNADVVIAGTILHLI